MNSKLADYFEGRGQEMAALLEELVLINSGTGNKPGVDLAQSRLAPEFEKAGMQVKRIAQEAYGDFVLASSPAAADDGNNILLMGHIDTVFPPESPFNWLRRDDDEGKLHGPGVCDMKGGLVCGLFALKALDQLGMLKDMPVRFFVNSDEERGSLASAPFTHDQAKQAAMAFVLEGGGMKGQVVTSRKGKIGLRLKVKGRAEHAAKASLNKASAILELAHKVIKIEELNGLAPGMLVNVGQMEGGIGPNTVPEEAWAAIDVRLAAPGDQELFMEKAENVAKRAQAVGVAASLEMVSSRPAMPKHEGNSALFEIWAQQASRYGYLCLEEFRSGVSDANLIAAAGTPVLDGLGPRGAGEHSDREFILIKSLAERSLLLAETLAKAWQLHQKGELFKEA